MIYNHYYNGYNYYMDTVQCIVYIKQIRLIDIKKVDKQLNVVYGTIRYERCSRNPLSGPLLFIYNNMYLSYIY